MPNQFGLIQDSGPDLVSLGVADPSKYPSASTIPRKFSAHGFAIWHKLMTSDEFKERLSQDPPPDELWQWSVEQYFFACAHSMIFPFRMSPEQSRTDVAVFMLSLARRQLKAFFKRTDFFKKMKIFNTSRRYILKPKAFEIEISAQLYPINDPTFEKWLRKHTPGPMFQPDRKARVYIRRLYETADSRCFIRMDCSYMQRPKLTVNIEFNSPIVLPYNSKDVSKEYIYRYIDENIWMPLVRTYKFDNSGWRLF